MVNPSVRPLQAAAVTEVGGDPAAPTSVTLSARAARSIRRGSILSSGPTERLPFGLLHRVDGVSRSGGRVVLALTPVPVTDALPRIAFDGDIVARPASDQTFDVSFEPFHGCDIGIGRAFAPSIRIGKLHPHLDIDVTPWGGAPHADMTVKTRLTYGFTVDAATKLRCELRGDPFTVVGAVAVGPVVVPVYLAVPVTVSVEAAAATTSERRNSLDLTVGMRAKRAGRSLAPALVFEPGPVDHQETRADGATYTAGASIGLELGVGLPRVANIHVALGNQLSFVREAAACRLDLDLGTLEVGGNAGPWSFSTPTFKPSTTTLWRGCAGEPIAPPAAPPTVLERQTPVTPDAHVAPGWTITSTYVSGQCGEGSDIAAAAYRCFPDDSHLVVDPCYAVAESETGDGTGVVCPRSPFTKELLAITTATGLGTLDDSSFDAPNGLVLSGGNQCVAAQGAHSADSSGRVVDYGCQGNTVVLRGLHTDNPVWTADLATYDETSFKYSSAGTQAIDKAVLLLHQVPPANRPITDAQNATTDELTDVDRRHHEVDCGVEDTSVRPRVTRHIFAAATHCYTASLLATDWDTGNSLEDGWSCTTTDDGTLLCRKASEVGEDDAPTFFSSPHLRAARIG